MTLHALQGRATGGLSLLGAGLAFLDWGVHLANAPFRRLDLGQSAFLKALALGAAALGSKVVQPGPHDHRFDDEAWSKPPFSLLAQGFLLTEEWWGEAACGPAGVSAADRRIVAFALRQWLDMLSPSNVALLNPEVLRATAATGGANFLAGLRNMTTDLQENLTGRPWGPTQLRLGVDLAATPGKVVYRNALMELIQYAPATAETARDPILIVPAWIMKYYILDLSAHNSLVRRLTALGHTVFMVSWRNPGPEMKDVGLDDYRTKGVMAALEVINDILPDHPIQACGYCLGGTLLTIAAAAMARDGDDRLAGVTLFCAQTDFTEAGELQLFITEDQLALLDEIMRAQGFLDSRQMAGSFQLLRSNNLIWSRLVRDYLLGEREHADDLMAWNADGTRMPARMHSEYLHQLFLRNDLAEGRLLAGGRPIALSDIRTPFFVVATETDHIAPWRSVHKLHLLTSEEITFVLASGGHNVGVVSEPGVAGRHYRTAVRPRGARYEGPDDWFAAATLHEGSWWPEWFSWLADRSGPKEPAPTMGSKRHPPLADAPGHYVLEH